LATTTTSVQTSSGPGAAVNLRHAYENAAPMSSEPRPLTGWL
jgi:hypothetical protein